MSDSDQSEGSLYYVSDDEVTSILHTRSSSSSNENLDIKDANHVSRRDSGRGSIDMTYNPHPAVPNRKPRGTLANGKSSLVSVVPSNALQKTSLIYDRERDEMFKACPVQICHLNTESQSLFTNSIISERLKNLPQTSGGIVYISTSFMTDWGISSEVPPGVVCDACVFSYSRPVRLLTFSRDGDDDDLLCYNTSIARHLVTKVRKRMFTNFTVVSGVIETSKCQHDDNFISMIKKMDAEAKRKFIPRWLYMDASRCNQLVEIFMTLNSGSGNVRCKGQMKQSRGGQKKFASRRKGSMPAVLPTSSFQEMSLVSEKKMERSSTLPRSCSEERKKPSSNNFKKGLSKLLKESEKLFDKHMSGWTKPRWLCNHDWRRVHSDITHRGYPAKREPSSSSTVFEQRTRKTHKRTVSTG